MSPSMPSAASAAPDPGLVVGVVLLLLHLPRQLGLFAQFRPHLLDVAGNVLLDRAEVGEGQALRLPAGNGVERCLPRPRCRCRAAEWGARSAAKAESGRRRRHRQRRSRSPHGSNRRGGRRAQACRRPASQARSRHPREPGRCPRAPARSHPRGSSACPHKAAPHWPAASKDRSSAEPPAHAHRPPAPASAAPSPR